MKYVRQTQGDSAIQTMQDICLSCGQYMPEGTGMVCPYCASIVRGLCSRKAVQIGE